MVFVKELLRSVAKPVGMRCAWLLALVLCAGCSRKIAREPSAAAAAPKRVLGPSRPFARHAFEYAAGTILPNSRDQGRLDKVTADFYDTWKERYLREGCGRGRVYVATAAKDGSVSTSRATGYGMLITALMAGHDPRARQHFDGLLSYFRSHQSALTEGLMAWYQGDGCRDLEGDSSRTDGDLDIAYALLLADKQWGSCGGVDYKASARWVIQAIERAELHREGRYMLLGDWVAPVDRDNYNKTRSSDFMPGHLRGFLAFTEQAWWVQVIDNGYWLLDRLQSRYSPNAGLVPNLIARADSNNPEPAPHVDGAERDGTYHAEACLVPLRLGTDYIAYGDRRAKRFLERMNVFVRGDAKGDPSLVSGGYDLSGQPMGVGGTMECTAPFGVGAMVDREYQDWLNRIWERAESAPPESYEADSVRLLSLLVMSGNWWIPDRELDPCGRP